MERLLLGLTTACGASLLSESAVALNLEGWAEELPRRAPDEALDLIVENGRSWPKLDALSNTDAALRGDVRLLTEQVLQVLKREARSVVFDSSEKGTIARTKRAMNVAKIAKTAGGYLNDLISVSAENVAITGAWLVLDQWPSSAAEIKKAVYRDSKKEPLWAKRWFTDRVELDSWLFERKERLDKVKDDTPGFQAGNYLGYERSYPNNEMPTVFDLIVLWLKVFYNDFNLASTIPAACDYLNRGGVLSPAPKNTREAVADAFGDEGVPYIHQLHGDSFRSDDIWLSHGLVVDERSRRVDFKDWFGE